MMYRDLILNRLKDDLVGPQSKEEVIFSRPSDVYLTGILWPKEAQMGQEEDDSPFDEDDNQSGSATPSLAGQMRPSSMGMSFAIGEDSREIIVKVSFGIYKSTESEGTQEKSRNHKWTRIPFEQSITLAFQENMGNSKREKHLGPEDTSFELHFRRQKIAEGWLCTITIINGFEVDDTVSPDRDEIESKTLFQARLQISLGGNRPFIPRPKPTVGKDFDSRMGALLYSKSQSYGTGHQCSVEWSESPEIYTLSSTWVPSTRVPAFSESGSIEFSNLVFGDRLSADSLSRKSKEEVLAALRDLTLAYSNWIEKSKLEISDLSNELQPIAHSHFEECTKVLSRMNHGIDFLDITPLAFQAFQLAMASMHLQHSWKDQGLLKWRPFQLGFVLLSLESTLNGTSSSRQVLDLLWFPTGGGKTEAYLALISITSWYRKLTKGLGGCVAFMRYTLRLLTAQQFERAVSLILASELLRRGLVRHHSLKRNSIRTPFSIGLWVGGDATPNRFDEAMSFKYGSGNSSPEQLANCPACDTKLKWNYDTKEESVNPMCVRQGCVLGPTFGLWPVFTIDQNLYEYQPTLVIGTVDKFAQVTFKADTDNLFQFLSETAPDLIIQDELHLISGPLGTLVGLYETALDWLLSKEGIRPKIIGSTATIRKATEQVHALFDRESCQFPPPGLHASDSGFAVVDSSKPGRLYAGITTAGRSAKFALQAVGGSLLQSGGPLGLVEEDLRDGYSTLLFYFNSLRELGGAIVQILDDVPDSIELYARARAEKPRDIPHSEEMTSRKSQDEILRILGELKKTCTTEYPVDAVLATNMVSVGVDVSRLGLMLVNGQPKTRAEYIQATSRVGRAQHPGLIVTVMNAAKPRDRSHFETFQTWHSAIYRDVEATSVTPFAPRARDRALKAVLVSMLRHSHVGMRDKPIVPSEMDPKILSSVVTEIERRVAGIASAEVQSVQKEIDQALLEWERRRPTHYENRAKPLTALIQRAEEFARKIALHRTANPGWPIMNSMRTVEPSTPFRLTEQLSSKGLPSRGDSPDGGGEIPAWRLNRGK